MKKIMFNDKYGLTKAVLEGRKTMTRRIMTPQPKWWRGDGVPISSALDPIWNTYNVGEVVAVAQNYKDAGYYPMGEKDEAGWGNKMFVKADLMPHQIRITNIRVERLQDISDEDCLREGIIEDCQGVQYSFPTEFGYCGQYPFDTPRGAFAALIDRVSGKGTWKSNPWVFVYQFELVK